MPQDGEIEPPKNKSQGIQGTILFSGESVDLEKTVDNVIIYNQKIFGSQGDFTIDQFLKETKVAFNLIGKELRKSSDFPVFIVDYSKCKVGRMSLKMLRIEVEKLFDGVTNKSGDIPVIHVVGVENPLLKLSVPIGEVFLKSKKLVTKIKRVSSLDRAIIVSKQWAKTKDNK
jgi:hypothetical protein